MNRTPGLLILSCVAALALGCGSSDSDPADAGASMSGDGMAMNHDGMSMSDGAGGGACDTYVDGISKSGAAFSVAIVSASPAPPEKGENTYTIKLTDASGAAVDDATLIVEPFMPAHGHGTVPASYAGKAKGADGVYELDPMDLFMPGTWELRVTVTGADGTTVENLTFTWCIEG